VLRLLAELFWLNGFAGRYLADTLARELADFLADIESFLAGHYAGHIQYSGCGYHKNRRNFMNKLLVLSLFGIGLVFSQSESFDRVQRDGPKLPNGKSQQEEILKAEHQKTLQDAAELVKLAEQLQDDLIKDDRHILSIATLKKTEDIEKLAKKIRSRLKK